MATLDDFKSVLSGDPVIDSLLTLDWYRPYPWPANKAITYSFLEEQTPPANPGGLYIKAEEVIAMNSIQKNATTALMDYVSDVLHLPVIQVSPEDSADIFFASADLSGTTAGLTHTAHSFQGADGVVTDFLATALVSMDISNAGATATDAPIKGNMGYEILLHEIGHSLGLRHPFSGPHAVEPGTDHTGLTIMSYTDGPESPYHEFQEWDLAALSYLYPSMENTPVITGTVGFDIQTVQADWNPQNPQHQAIADKDTITITLGEQITIYEDIERIDFNNGTLAFDREGGAGQVYRLYQTALDRQADNAGISYWVSQMDKGSSLQDVAIGFTQSAEFNVLYGETDNSLGFLTALYQNALDRAPDSDGLNFWMDKLATGSHPADILAGFSESLEQINNTNNQLNEGVWLI